MSFIRKASQEEKHTNTHKLTERNRIVSSGNKIN